MDQAQQAMQPNNLIIALAGALLALAFSPVNCWPVLLLCPGVLFLGWLPASKTRQVLLPAACFACGFFTVSVSWVYVSIHRFGGTNAVSAMLITALFIAFLSTYTLLQGIIWYKLFSRTRALWIKLLGFALCWTLASFCRAHALTGFPWALIGEATVTSPFAGFVPLLGNYGITVLLVATSCLIVLALAQSNYYNLCLSLLLTLGLGVVGVQLKGINWSSQINRAPMRVALVQANIPQAIKWQPGTANYAIDRYQRLTTEQTETLTIWPEAALVYPWRVAKITLKPLIDKLTANKRALISGVITRDDKSGLYQNSAVAVGYQASGLYHKRILVPFGEDVPPVFAWLNPIIAKLAIPMSHLEPGRWHQPLFKISNTTLGMLICYEVAYTRAVASAAHANVLVTISDDAWFGHSFAPYQHLQIARFRALEFARPMLMLGNTGQTALIGPKGQLQKRLPGFTTAVLSSNVSSYVGMTPFAHYANKGLAMILAGLIVLLALFARFC